MSAQHPHHTPATGSLIHPQSQGRQPLSSGGLHLPDGSQISTLTLRQVKTKNLREGGPKMGQRSLKQSPRLNPWSMAVGGRHGGMNDWSDPRKHPSSSGQLLPRPPGRPL